VDILCISLFAIYRRARSSGWIALNDPCIYLMYQDLE